MYKLIPSTVADVATFAKLAKFVLPVNVHSLANPEKATVQATVSTPRVIAHIVANVPVLVKVVKSVQAESASSPAKQDKLIVVEAASIAKPTMHTAVDVEKSALLVSDVPLGNVN